MRSTVVTAYGNSIEELEADAMAEGVKIFGNKLPLTVNTNYQVFRGTPGTPPFERATLRAFINVEQEDDPKLVPGKKYIIEYTIREA